MPITLTREFALALDRINDRNNVLITGKAGTGKSTLLRTWLRQARNRNVLVTAPTGVAALNIDGFTIHRSFGFRPGMYPDDVAEGGMWKPSARVRELIRAVEVLVIDEVSMVRADLFDMVDIALQRIKGIQKPFGGVQLVLVGDLLQLPPVVTNNEAELFGSRWATPYFFSAHSYESLKLVNINLTTVWRQSDTEFLEILNQVREGSVGSAALAVLNAQVDPNFTPPDDWVTLASHRRTVDGINTRRINALTTPHFTSIATHNGQTDSSSFSGSEELNYAVGARVMTIINDPGGRFVNGSFGSITAATSDQITVQIDATAASVELQRYTWEIKRPIVESGHLSSTKVGTVTQFPVILAWAITIHKSQGKTIPRLYIDLKGGTSTDGQFYVALSRAVDLQHLRFSAAVEPKHIQANNTLVRRIRRETGTKVKTSRLVILSFDGVSFGLSDHIARVHATVLEGGQTVADFGSWLNPMADLGDFGKRYHIPSGGLALAPTLGDFWPLLLRQAAGAIVIGDRLPMLERAVRQQEKSLDLALGNGYDVSELNIEPHGDDVVTRCHSIRDSLKATKVEILAQPVPVTPQDTEGAVFIPSWARKSPMLLDNSRATDSDRAWAAFSGGDIRGLVQAEVAETAELLSAWAVSRGYWTNAGHDEVVSRARMAGLSRVNLPAVEDNKLDLMALFIPGTRVAFTGCTNLLGEQSDDERLRQICSARNLEYKGAVSKTRCDVLVANDPASMSRKAQNAREYGKPIVSQREFEDWYRKNLPTDLTSRRVLKKAEVRKSAESSTTTLQPVRPEQFLHAGTRIAFRGSTYVNGKLYPQGDELQGLCSLLQLEYKQAVTKTRCDVLVTDDLQAADGKMRLAVRYQKPVVKQEDFAVWASVRLTEIPAQKATSAIIQVEDEETIDEEKTAIEGVATELARTSEMPAADETVSQEITLRPKIDREAITNRGKTVPTPAHTKSLVAADTSFVRTASIPGTLQRSTAHAASPIELPTSMTTRTVRSHAKATTNKASKRCAIAAVMTVICFVAMMVFAFLDESTVGAILMIVAMFFSFLTLLFGVQALIYRIRHRKDRSRLLTRR